MRSFFSLRVRDVILLGMTLTILGVVGGLLAGMSRIHSMIFERLQRDRAAALQQLETRLDVVVERLQDETRRQAERRFRDELGGLARLAAALGAAPLLTNDNEKLNNICALVCREPGVLLCSFQDRDGRLLTDFRNADHAKIAALVPDVENASLEQLVLALGRSDNTDEFSSDVAKDGTRLGSVRIFASNRRSLARQAAVEQKTAEMVAPLKDEIAMSAARDACILGDADESLFRYGTVAALVAFAGGLLAALVLSNWYGRPIADAVSVLEAVRAGDLRRRMKRYRATEFDRMAVAMNEAINTLGRSLEDYRAISERERQQADELKLVVARQIRTEKKLRHAKKAAEDASEAKSRFLANISHEIRTPLNAVLGYATLLRDESESLERSSRLEYAASIHASGHHLLSLIDDVLDLSKIEAGHMVVEKTACSPHQVIAEVISLTRVKAHDKGLSLRAVWPDNTPRTIWTDGNRLRQAVANLVGNAIKFTSTGGVSVVTELVEAPSEACRLQIRVIDTGIGMTPDKLDQIFEPFVQADESVTRRYGGTGLGLAIARHIARALGGDIVVRSEPGLGTTFTLTVETGPIDRSMMVSPAEADGLAARRCRQPVDPRVLPPIDVLLVEDGETNRRLISLMLQRGGVQVTTAENGLQGVEAIMRRHFDVVLMDMQMPVMDGYTATRRLRENGITLPVVALTAHAMSDDARKCFDAGCTDYLTKPVDPNALLATLAKYVPAKWLEGQQPAATSGQNAPSPETLPELERSVARVLDTHDMEFRSIARQFLDGLPHRIEEMEAARVRGDRDALAMFAHRLKSASGMVGVSQLAEPAARLEAAAAQEDDAERLLHEVRELTAMVGRIAPLVREETPVEATDRPADCGADDTRRPLTMIVDDEPVNVQIIRKDLRGAGFRHFVTATDPRDALPMIRETRPDLILLDLLMPRMSGLQVLRQIRDEPSVRRLPVVMLTANVDAAARREALELGATDFLTKPISAEELIPRVKNVLMIKSQHDALIQHSNRLEDEVRHRTADLAVSRLELIHCLARAAECRDNETGRHVIRVGRFVGIIGRGMGLASDFVELMEHAAPLHDVGKIGIPDNILLSPDRLDEAAFAVMKQHCDFGHKTFQPISDDEWVSIQSHTFLGENILEANRSPIIEMAATIALTHHEKWDGSGYPRGLRGEEIPLAGRITAVADVFDALSSERPYKKAFPTQRCFELLEEGRGTHFDPRVLDAFFASVKEILEIQRRYADTDGVACGGGTDR